MRHSIRGLIIRNNKILLVTGHEADFYWTPGGGKEWYESDLQALRRELREELGVTLVAARKHSTVTYNNTKVTNYLADIQGDIHTGSEITGYAWYEVGDDLTLSTGFEEYVLPVLIEDKLLILPKA